MAEKLLFLTEILGLKVFDLKGRRIGVVKDAAVVPLVDPVRVDRFLIGGVGTAWLIAVVVRSFTSMPMSLPPSSIAIGVGLSSVVGLFFGIYPARQASLLDPIEALRVER